MYQNLYYSPPGGFLFLCYTLSMKLLFILISSILALISPIIYIRSILAGQTKPHRTTRFVLLVISFLATISLFAQHDTVAIWLAGIAFIQAIFIFFVSLRRGMGGWSVLDILCLVIALLGIILWQTTKDPAIALYASIGADFTGMIPALIKTYKWPHTEIWTFYVLDVFAGLFSMMAVKQWTPQEYMYPLYITGINLVMALLILRPKLFKMLAR